MNQPPIQSSENQSIRLYLDLMKKALTDSLYIDDPMAQVVPLDPSKRRRFTRSIFSMLKSSLGKRGILLAEKQKVWYDAAEWSQDELENRRREGRDWPVRAHTMVGLERLDNIQYCAETIIAEQVPGDFIETGVWRGGATIFMKAILKAYAEERRRVFVADSFAGLPPPDGEAYPVDQGSDFHTWEELAISRQAVENNFRRYDLLDDGVVFLEGWFRDTLPTAPIEQIALLRLDGDMYESTIQALDALYHKVSPGGFMIIDDYHIDVCQRAVHDFLDSRGEKPEIKSAGTRGVFWRV